MVVDQSQMAVGTAWITPDGILFQGRYYSCRRALREGWFSRAADAEAEAVEVLYDEAAGFIEAIYIDSEEFQQDGLCHLLPGKVLSGQTAAYQERIRKLQEERKLLLGGGQ
ncbi:hypothetical protein [Gorillibacterium sp. sgz5001074]|uniref:hypothetical protein n=1 Tax=Gorillibacterium sp. sgz5001074 TaxID=3446695 RepID=UPI003F67B982